MTKAASEAGIDPAVNAEESVFKDTQPLTDVFALYDKLDSNSNSDLVISRLTKLIESDKPILLTGPTGTGKTRVAQYIGKNSGREDPTFVTINCANFKGDLFSSEMFGHVKGAYTGAVSETGGYVGLTGGGTLFLDEISEMSDDAQAQLLRFIQTGYYNKVGSPKESRANVRIIAATNRDVPKALEEGKLRSDLLYRLGYRINMLPVSERLKTVPRIADYMIARISDGKKTLSRETIDMLSTYSFPGNFREMYMMLDMANLFSEADVIKPGDLEFTASQAKAAPIENKNLVGQFIAANQGIQNIPETFEIEAVKYALSVTKNHEEAAQHLGLSQRQVRHLLRKYELNEYARSVQGAQKISAVEPPGLD